MSATSVASSAEANLICTMFSMCCKSKKKSGFPGLLSLCIQDHRCVALAHHDDLCIGRFCDLQLRLDALILQLPVGQALADDMLIIGDTLGFHSFPFRLLPLFLQHELHLL